MTPLLVGLDVGTTSVKAVVYEPDGRAVALATAPTPTHYPRPGWAFYRAEELWGLTVRVLRDALGQVDDPRRVAGIAVASMGEAGVPLDAGGEPTADVIAWFDTRTRPQAEWLDRVIGKDALFARSGLSLQPIFSLCKLLWLKEHAPDAWRRTVRWLHVADYVAFRLCGVAATDFSLASRTLAFNLHAQRWDEDTIGAAGLEPGLFAPLVAGGTRLGPVTAEAAAATGLPAGAIVAAGGHDHLCGALAVGVTGPDRLLDSLGTAESLCLPLERPLTDQAMARQGYTQGAHVTGGYYLIASQYTAGGSLEWLREAVGAGADHATLTTEAEREPAGSLGVCFLPHLRLASPPIDDPRSRGAFVGLTADVKRGTLVRAVLEGLAFEACASLEPMLAFAGVTAQPRIIAIGGGTRNRLLMRIKASVMNQDLTIVDVEEATALGAALLGGLGADVYPDVPTALGTLRVARTLIEPMPEQVPVYDAIFRRVYQRLYPAVAPLSHAIGDLQAARSTGAS